MQEENTRSCRKCAQEKPLSQFPVRGQGVVTGRQWHAGECKTCFNRKKHLKDKEKGRGDFRLRSHVCKACGVVWQSKTKTKDMTGFCAQCFGIARRKPIDGKKIDEHCTWQALRWCVFHRDGFACVVCHATGIPLEADHILAKSTHPELAADISNLRTLCRACHRERTREQRLAGVFAPPPPPRPISS